MSGGMNAKFEFEACRKFEFRSAETVFDTAQNKLRAQRTFIRKSLCTLWGTAVNPILDSAFDIRIRI